MIKYDKFYHYSICKIPKIVKRNYRSRLWFTEVNKKPQGFWISIEDPDQTDCDTWFDICNNDAMRYRLKYKYQVTLHPYQKYLLIKNAKELDEFSDTFGYWKTYVSTHPLQQAKEAQNKIKNEMTDLAKMLNINRQTHLCDRLIDWNWVMGIYKGIIINPYIHERRDTYMWYNGWDCPSGCIWDTNCIKRIEYVNG